MKVNVNIVFPPENVLRPFSSRSDVLPAVLTDEHSACSYGQPVVLIHGCPYGHADLARIDKGYQIVIRAEYTDTEPVERVTTPEQRKMVDRAKQAGYQVYRY